MGGPTLFYSPLKFADQKVFAHGKSKGGPNEISIFAAPGLSFAFGLLHTIMTTPTVICTF